MVWRGDDSVMHGSAKFINMVSECCNILSKLRDEVCESVCLFFFGEGS